MIQTQLLYNWRRGKVIGDHPCFSEHPRKFYTPYSISVPGTRRSWRSQEHLSHLPFLKVSSILLQSRRFQKCALMAINHIMSQFRRILTCLLLLTITTTTNALELDNRRGNFSRVTADEEFIMWWTDGVGSGLSVSLHVTSDPQPYQAYEISKSHYFLLID